MYVHVLSKDGRALTPCHPARARKLLKSGKAKPYNGNTGVFTIQLQYDRPIEYTMPVVLGIDPGSNVVPIAAIGNSKVFYAKEKILRTDVSKQLQDRATARRERRGRKRHRKPRFNNRVKTRCACCGVNHTPKLWKKKKRKYGKSKKKVCTGRARLCRVCAAQKKKGMHNRPHILAPSNRNRAQSIINDALKLSETLPISHVMVEIASFDAQKMANAFIKGVEYQHDTLEGLEIKAYLLNVHKHKCAYCRGLTGDNILEVEHLQSKKREGTDKISNLAIACRECNLKKGVKTLEEWRAKLIKASEKIVEIDANGKEKIRYEPEINDKRIKATLTLAKQRDLKKGFQYSARTQSYKNYLLEELRKHFSVGVTYGYRTKYYRHELGLEKSQINDALVIASQGKPFELPDSYIIERQIKKRRPANYIGSKITGQPRVIKKWEDEVHGFRLWDRVACEHPEFGLMVGYVSTRREGGAFRIYDMKGRNLIGAAKDAKYGRRDKPRDGSISYKKLRLLRRQISNYVRETVPYLPEPVQLTFPWDISNRKKQAK